MPTNDYIPHTDSGFRDWATTFAAGITANPALYMMTAAQAASIQQTVDDFNAAYLANVDPATRTKATVIAKDNARSVAQSLCRQYAILIKENAGIDDADKVNVGVRPVNPSRDPIQVPMTSPLMAILGNLPGTQTLEFRDPLNPTSKAKPFGASEIQVFRAVADVESAPLTEARFLGKFTRNPIPVDFDQVDDGKIATYYARWCSPRGDVGPWSIPISMRIAA